ncbi:MAG: cytochrome C [Holophagae bacterium]|nr:cytochrome C [Holophagae bacterium]
MEFVKRWMLVSAAVLVLVAPLFGNDCITSECHQNFRKFRVLHAPVEDDCTSCHEETGKHKFAKPEGSVKDACYACHDDKEAGKHLHAALEMKDCLFCHNPHGGNSRALIRTGRMDTLCYECHEKADKTGKYIHGPNVSGNCAICHEAHSSNTASLLVEPAEELCINCHTDKTFTEKGMHRHTPLEEGCTGCHSPHASSHVYQLEQSGQALCATCHEDITDAAAKAKAKHLVLESREKCLNCHDAHGSPYENNLKKGQMALCMSCHDKSIIGTDGKDHNIAKILRKNPVKHGPVKDGNCSGCHNPHGSDYYMLLSGAYPEKFYTEFDETRYALCFQCHEAALVEKAETTVQTNFRNGKENLHYFHINRKKGRTCRACHMVHASNLPKHIREETPFGKWDIPIEFSQTKTGGSCSPGCHKPYSYDRVNPDSYDSENPVTGK